MRIQHNIPAMNSLTNYTRNNNALAGNLEKLSSGYRINSAADDAAGLAISEKMRSQIKGLEKAYDNANDGISLVQTAEGALTEVNSMLTRLKELATQSANGTYENAVDRENIQQETDQILEEIDRISKATNFNGKNLLDGTLGSGSNGAQPTRSLGIKVSKTAAAASALGTGTNVPQVSETGTLFGATAQDVAVDDVISLSIEMSDGTKKDISFKFTGTGTAATYEYTGADGSKKTGNATLNAANKMTHNEAATIAAAILNDDETFAAQYTAAAATGAIKFTSAEATYNDASIKHITTSKNGTVLGEAAGNVTTAPKADFKTLDVSKLSIFTTGTATGAGTANIADAIFEVDGKKFALVENQDAANKLDEDVTAIVVGNQTALTATTAVPVINALNAALGTNISTTPSAGTTFDIISKGSAGAATTGEGLVLQIGDTNDDFNQVTVSIDDMSSKGIGIDGLDLGTLDAAAASIDRIKEAVNTVAKQRGKLGALQNRLDHTLNNLEATTENITSSESQIRDVNMAKEMTAYTKNNILAQAAQSMLAQANSMPQGVLQLLQ